ncbi:hypothetical protein SAMN04488096_104302 [Mesonia phycicola]|uniref:Uncharacterized protein n=1 Tax=Mesonia phycicola TaxID=579105 RepID=A0A1M6E1J3_9FLAO|nr:DUF6452 family protein [Mesonia phycicola]SHI79346.1 hypothetical protein SAMN04488096_104302 [Mesonia phycicola]
MKKYTLFTIIIALLFTSSCQKDDICPEATQTTPKLVIEFFDIENPELSKSVSNLNVIAEGQTDYYFETTEDLSTITIPLNTAQDFTNYTFVRNYDVDEDSPLVTNEDQIQFSYAVNLEYVNRACSYKAEFLNFNAVLIIETDEVNWIKAIEVLQPNEILDEEDTHLYIYH